MGIGSKLTELMRLNETNANELALKLGVSPQTIYSLIKRDSKKADIDMLARIAEVLGVTLEYFVNENDEPVTLAAHFDGTEFTAEELEEIRMFAKFIKHRRSES